MEMAAGGIHRWGLHAEFRPTLFTIDRFDGAHTPARAHLMVSSQLAAPSRYMWIRPFLSRTLTNSELESPYRGQIPRCLKRHIRLLFSFH